MDFIIITNNNKVYNFYKETNDVFYFQKKDFLVKSADVRLISISRKRLKIIAVVKKCLYLHSYGGQSGS